MSCIVCHGGRVSDGWTGLRRFLSPVGAIPHPCVVESFSAKIHSRRRRPGSTEQHHLSMSGIVRHGVKVSHGGAGLGGFRLPVGAVPHPGVVEKHGAGSAEQHGLAMRGIVSHGVAGSPKREVLWNLPRPIWRTLRRHHRRVQPQQQRASVPPGPRHSSINLTPSRKCLFASQVLGNAVPGIWPIDVLVTPGVTCAGRRVIQHYRKAVPIDRSELVRRALGTGIGCFNVPMYLSLNGVPIGGKLAWPDFAHLASRTGFKGVDVALEECMALGLDRTRHTLEETKLRPAFANLPTEFRKDEATFRSTLPKLEEAAPFMAAIGCPRMMTWIMPSSDTPKDELRRTYKKRFTECANILARSHCRLGLEFLGPLHFRRQSPNVFIWKMSEMLEFAKECGTNVGLTLDSWHWHHAGATTGDILAAGKDRIVV